MVRDAIASGVVPRRSAAVPMSARNSPAMWPTSSRVPWNAEFATREQISSAMGVTPRASASAPRSSTSPTAPMPMIMP